MEKVTFGFTKNTVSFSEEEFNEKIAKEEGGGGKFLDVGEHTVEITDACIHLNKNTQSAYSAKDPSWLNVKVELTSGEKSKLHFLLVPTKRLEFNPEESKRPMWAFVKFRAFMASIGETVLANVDSLNEVLPRYFSDPAKGLKGKRLKVTIGWNGPHIKFLGKDQYKIVNKDDSDNELFPMVFTTKEDAIQEAALNGLTSIQAFPEILTFSPLDEVKATKVAIDKAVAKVTSIKKSTKPAKKVVAELDDDEAPTIAEDADDWE